jgi:putative transposase
LLIDAMAFEGKHMVAALGIDGYGRKTILGIRQGATENATVVGELLGDLLERVKKPQNKKLDFCFGMRY